MYENTISVHENVELLYNKITANKWAVFGCFRELYNNDFISDIYVSDDIDVWIPWECARDLLIRKKFSNVTVSKDMYKLLLEFKNSYLPNINVDVFESFTIGKMFLNCIAEENLNILPLICSNFTQLPLFLRSIDLLYKQKFNIQKIKLLFNEILFDNVHKDFPEDSQIKFDILNVLSNKINNVPITIKLKRLKPYESYINKYITRYGSLRSTY